MNRTRLVSLAVVALLGAPLGCSSDSPKNEDQPEEQVRAEQMEQRQDEREAPGEAKRDVLGQWSGNDVERLIIYRRDGSHYLEERSEGETVRTTELNLEEEGSDKILRPVDDHPNCGHFVIDFTGNLQCHFKEKGARPERKMKGKMKVPKYRKFSPIDE